MLFESNFFEALFGALLVGLIFTIAYKFWGGVKTDEVEKAILNFKISTVSTGFMCMFLLILLPSPTLTSIGSQSISDIQSSGEVLGYLQNYESAISRTTQVLHFFIFFFVWGFLSSVYYVTKLFDKMREKELLQNRKEKITS